MTDGYSHTGSVMESFAVLFEGSLILDRVAGDLRRSRDCDET